MSHITLSPAIEWVYVVNCVMYNNNRSIELDLSGSLFSIRKVGAASIEKKMLSRHRLPPTSHFAQAKQYVDQTR